MTAYCLFQNLEITNSEGMKEYIDNVKSVTSSFGGEYVVSGGNVEKIEGDWEPSWPVIIKFPTMEKAKAWYASEEYKPLKELRMRSGNFSAVFIEGND